MTYKPVDIVMEILDSDEGYGAHMAAERVDAWRDALVAELERLEAEQYGEPGQRTLDLDHGIAIGYRRAARLIKGE